VGGRWWKKKDPDIEPTLARLVEGQTGGDPMTNRKWVRRSLRHLSGDLGRQGHQASPNTVGRLLCKQDYSLKSNRKAVSGPAHPDRDRQFRHIGRQRQAFTAAGQPVISIDAKKKELVGNFKNAGVAWRREEEPVNIYDFIRDAECRATPYGVYDVTRNQGAVAVGTSADTAQFATDCIAGWWGREGRRVYPQARQLLVLADGGGSNGYRSRLFKTSLQRFANDSGMAVTVCHYPTGASKWNPIEHRLFGPISVNWAAKPLRSLQVMLGCIRGTTTQTGLRVRAWLNTKRYLRKIKVSNAEIKTLNLQRPPICPNWNYTIHPQPLHAGP
jgi:hypothetical protein